MASKHYQELTDIEKLQKQWHKLSGLHSREEWSAAIVRAATAAELAANHAIRGEFAARSQFDRAFVDSLLKWANGLSGKLRKLLTPLVATDPAKRDVVAALQTLADRVNAKRNAIAHQGEFCNEQEATEVIANASNFITGLVTLYEPQFKLKDRGVTALRGTRRSNGRT
jgi:hypothetical protein